MDITRLPPEILSHIHHNLMEAGASGPAAEQTAMSPRHAPLSAIQSARRAAAARANFPSVCKLFRDVDKTNLSFSRNADIQCQLTANGIKNLAKGPAEKFEERLSSLFSKTANIEVDFSTLSTDEAAIVLRVLRKRAQEGQGSSLRNVRLNVDLDAASADLKIEMNDAITAIRDSVNGEHASFELRCSSHDPKRTSPPDLSEMTNLTSVDFSGCKKLTTFPDFSHNPKLETAIFSGCVNLRGRPNFLKNQNLTTVDFSECEELTTLPNFSNNPELTTVNFSGCISLEYGPDISEIPNLETFDSSEKPWLSPVFFHNPKLKTVIFFGCSRLRDTPDFSNNPDLTTAIFSECRELLELPSFLKNPNLRTVDFSWCDQIWLGPDFSKNSKLIYVNFSGCINLLMVESFSENPDLEIADFSGCENLRFRPDFSKNSKLRMTDFSGCPVY